jgi:hypothetical protein
MPSANQRGYAKRNVQQEDPAPRRGGGDEAPTGGPTTGATMPGHVIVAIARISLAFSVLRTTIIRPTGTIIAPPTPWSRRAAVNVSTPSDEPA